jgi:peroxiredoxin
VGEKAPDFTLPDQDGKPVKLSAVLSESEGPKNAPALLLIFYRGYW